MEDEHSRWKKQQVKSLGPGMSLVFLRESKASGAGKGRVEEGAEQWVMSWSRMEPGPRSLKAKKYAE